LREPRVHVADAVRDHRQVAGVVFEVGLRAGNCADKPAAVPERYEAIIAAVPYLDRDRNGSHLEPHGAWNNATSSAIPQPPILSPADKAR
jgi:hypothetical protein